MKKEKNLAEMNFNGEIFPNWQIFTYLAIINFLISFLASEFIYTRDFYYTIFSDQMELTRIDKYVDIIKRFSFWSEWSPQQRMPKLMFRSQSAGQTSLLC